MPKWIIGWDSGFGEGRRVVDTDTQANAERIAYCEMMEEFESNRDSWAKLWTEELAQKYGAQDEVVPESIR